MYKCAGYKHKESQVDINFSIKATTRALKYLAWLSLFCGGFFAAVLLQPRAYNIAMDEFHLHPFFLVFLFFTTYVTLILLSKILEKMFREKINFRKVKRLFCFLSLAIFVHTMVYSFIESHLANASQQNLINQNDQIFKAISEFDFEDFDQVEKLNAIKNIAHGYGQISIEISHLGAALNFLLTFFSESIYPFVILVLLASSITFLKSISRKKVRIESLEKDVELTI